MHGERIIADLPVPEYFPNFRSSPSTYMSRGKTRIPVRAPSITKKWRGLLFEEGRYIKDPTEAYGRAATLMVNHEEAGRTLDLMLEKTGRELSPRQLADFQGGADGSEVLIAPTLIKNQLSIRGEILGDVVSGMGEGKSIVKATRDALETLSDKALEDLMNGIRGSKVYAVPKAVADQIDREFALQFCQNIRLFWDGPMNLWKASVLSLSPRWLVDRK